IPLQTSRFNLVALSALVAAACALLTSCGTTRTASTHSLPPYEPPIAKTDFQNVRTTAYTHTEDDHLAYGAHNALGGVLQTATVPADSDRTLRALPVTSAWSANDEMTFVAMSREKKAAHAKKEKKEKAREAKAAKKEKAAKTAKAAKAAKGKHEKIAKATRVHHVEPPRIGSAAADWSRWPVGTTFRVLSTGQTYRVDDYGWALAGRNTIDLYMGSRRDMNNWGVRHEQIQVLHWGDAAQSLALLEQRARFKHCRRMALELQGLHDQAAALH
ncbi:MAG: hypothetical protein ABR526_14360, partial [Chthoniobacterales bacterium]